MQWWPQCGCKSVEGGGKYWRSRRENKDVGLEFETFVLKGQTSSTKVVLIKITDFFFLRTYKPWNWVATVWKFLFFFLNVCFIVKILVYIFYFSILSFLILVFLCDGTIQGWRTNMGALWNEWDWHAWCEIPKESIKKLYSKLKYWGELHFDMLRLKKQKTEEKDIWYRWILLPFFPALTLCHISCPRN